MNLTGTWHIQSMELWDEDYFNMEVQAYITIESNYIGEFQFGLVTGDLDGSISGKGDEASLHFSWEGGDENDPAFGRGWCKLKDSNTLEGEIKFHFGDSSGFEAVRAA
ncbi:MAG: hypothetical protein AAF821_25370 [Cyanobacteria bacterium P01_D01_bin.156]